MRRAIAAVLAAAAVAATLGCGVRPTGILSAGTKPIANGRASTMTLYLVREARLVKVVRPGLPGHPYLSLSQLAVPVTVGERRQGLHTEVRGPGGLWPYLAERSVLVVRLADVRFGADGAVRSGGRWSRIALAQVVCTAQAAPGVSDVQIMNEADPDARETTNCDRFSDLLG
ncbi:hypothetical protein [Actinomadura sp. B10D3]|uniref:hypothetical protein n=1 Tax=Actinomadura sp. B10D3 TaxID=3153557 RepID=UPI00325D47BD